MLEHYNVKVNRGQGFRFEGCELLNPDDTPAQKEKQIEKIKKKYKVKSGEYLNISNFFNVYF